MKTAVIGANGLIGGALTRELGAIPLAATAPAEPPAEVDLLIYAGRDPRLGRADWSIDADREWAWARAAARAGARFVQLSTRKVYAPSPHPLTERSPLGPTDRYGSAKLAMEGALAELFGPALTIVRLANVFGDEFTRPRASFFRAMSRSLIEQGEIRFDMSPFVKRDFFPLAAAARAIAVLARAPAAEDDRPRIFNLGSGVSLPCGRIALALIEGFGAGRLVIECGEERDGFAFDLAAARPFGIEPLDEETVLAECETIGASLAARAEAPLARRVASVTHF